MDTAAINKLKEIGEKIDENCGFEAKLKNNHSNTDMNCIKKATYCTQKF